MRWTRRRLRLGKPGLLLFSVVLNVFTLGPDRAEASPSEGGLRACFDANSLWVPAGRTPFSTLPGTHVEAVGQMNFGFATELLHDPVRFRVASPDIGGRDVHAVNDALDASLLFAISAYRDLELSFVLPVRLYQTGAGTAGITSQSAPGVEQSALRDPRLGVAYSLGETLGERALGLRVGVEASLPLGEPAAFAGERAVVLQPSVTGNWQFFPFTFSARLGARLRKSVDIADTRLGNQGVIALGAGIDLFDPGLLFLSLEASAEPPLGSSRAATADASITAVSLFPAEWSFAASSCPRHDWSVSASVGTGIPLSSETRNSTSGDSTARFLGVTTPSWRTLLTVRFAPN